MELSFVNRFQAGEERGMVAHQDLSAFCTVISRLFHTPSLDSLPLPVLLCYIDHFWQCWCSVWSC